MQKRYLEVNQRIKYDPKTGLFLWLKGFRKGKNAGYIDKEGYRRIHFNSDFKVPAHRIAFFLMTGKIPKMIDHINRNKSDNRWVNLRKTNSSKNQVNCIRTAFVGAAKKGTKYQAQIRIKGKRYYLGRFKTQAEAHKAYKVALNKAHQKEWIPQHLRIKK